MCASTHTMEQTHSNTPTYTHKDTSQTHTDTTPTHTHSTAYRIERIFANDPLFRHQLGAERSENTIANVNKHIYL